MLSVAAALDQIVDTARPLEPLDLPLDQVLGLTLADDILATLDSPPFDKSLMDGYAVRIEELRDGATFHVIETITAGKVPTRPLGPGEATQVMTGAPLPAGADAVVKVEDTHRTEDQLRVTGGRYAAGANLMRQGTSLRQGMVALNRATVLNGPRIGALAELGCSRVRVFPRPRVAVLATGDELVPVDQAPGAGQIRNSNESMLVAQVLACGAVPVPLGIARDNRESLAARISEGLAADILVLSGGVSAGTHDLVPEELARSGVREVFHKIEMKPGKPLWFGCRDEGTVRQLVFGLPGNPVSSLVCFELFVRTAIRCLRGESTVRPQPIPARLGHAHAARADRPTYHPARLTWGEAGAEVVLTPWHGSSDLSGTVAANAMAFLPGSAHQYVIGDRLDVYPW